jgi:hypothetical protein
MLIKEIDLAVVDTLGNFLSNLMRASTTDHVQLRPSVFSLGSRGGSDEETVFQLSLEIVFLDMVGKHGWNFPVQDG